MVTNYLSKIYILFIFISTFGCETPKHLTKKGNKLLEKEFYYDACTYYFKALNKNSVFIKAKEGLKDAGEKQIDTYLDNFFRNKSYGNKRRAIYNYLDAVKLKDKIETYSINIEISQMYRRDFNTLLDEYVEKSYNNALEFLNNENFPEAEEIFHEISILKPNFRDVNSMKDIATYEPIYRKANELLEIKKFRSSYYEFDKIPLNYKKCREKKNLAQNEAMYSIAILKFENHTTSTGLENSISSQIVDKLISINNPFLKIVDRRLTNTIINEQILGMSGQVKEKTNAKAGELIGAKAVLSGNLANCNQTQIPLEKIFKKGWFRTIKTIYNEDKTKSYDTTLEKIKYNIIKGSNNVEIGFNFQLTSTESGEILISKLINKSKKDEVYYAQSNLDYRKIFPGNWIWQNRKSSDDYISSSKSEKRALDRLFRSKKNLLSIDQLTNNIVNQITNQVTQQINNYNPEND